jgi:multiple sugar transport system permease protein
MAARTVFAAGASRLAPGASQLRRARGGRSRTGSHTVIAWVFMLPFGILFLLFTAVPTVASLATSLTDMRSTDLRSPFNVDFVGLENYLTLLRDQEFARSVLNTLVFVAVGVPLTMLAGFTLALALDSGIRRFRSVFRGLFYAPVVTNVVSVALIWQYAFNQSGTVNEVLAKLGFAGPNWLGDVHLAMPVVILLGIWRNFGTAMLLFLAGLQAVPEDVIEAAAIDGAKPLRRLWSITLPLLMRTTLLVSVLLSVFYLQVFDEPYLLTNGGPLGSTESMSLYIYNQFGFGNFGVSSAGSFVLLVFVVVFSAVQFRLLRPRS